MVVIREPFAQALTLALTETFENMAFLEVLPSSAPARDPLAEPPLCVALPLIAPVQGELQLRVPRALLGQIAATLFLRAEADIDEALRSDIAAELINTLGGRLLSRLFCPTQLFQLGLPQPRPGSVEGDPSGVSWYFKAENQIFALDASGEHLLALLDQAPETDA